MTTKTEEQKLVEEKMAERAELVRFDFDWAKKHFNRRRLEVIRMGLEANLSRYAIFKHWSITDAARQDELIALAWELEEW